MLRKEGTKKRETEGDKVMGDVRIRRAKFRPKKREEEGEEEKEEKEERKAGQKRE